MPTNTNTGYIAGPQALAAALNPNAYAQLQVQAQQIARNQQLADALRQQALQDTPANGGRISWTQGLARLASALVSRSKYKEIDQQTQDYLGKQAALQGALFGIGPQQPQPTPASPAPAPSPSPAMPDDGASGTPNSYSGTAAPMPPMDQVSNTPTPQPPQAPQQSPMSSIYPDLPGQGRMASIVQAMSSPSTYYSALNSANAPTDFQKLWNGYQAAVQSGDQATAQSLKGQLDKLSAIQTREGGTAEINGQFQYSPHVPEGYQPIRDATGAVTSIAPIQGGPAAVQGSAAAKAVGGAAGDIVQVYNPQTQQMVNVPKSALLSGAANGGAPFAAGPPLGATAAADVTGRNSANAFQDISNGAADVPNRIYALRQMASIVANPNAQFGHGSEGTNKFYGTLATLSQSAGISAPDSTAATNANEFQKWATQYSARSGQELGLSGSDARTQLAVHATPNGEMTRQALQSVIPQMIGIENAKQGYAQAANLWQQHFGPQTVQQFRTEWNRIYDPSIYTHMVQGSQAFAAWVKTLSPQQAGQVRQKYLALKSLGALPQ